MGIPEKESGKYLKKQQLICFSGCSKMILRLWLYVCWKLNYTFVFSIDCLVPSFLCVVFSIDCLVPSFLSVVFSIYCLVPSLLCVVFSIDCLVPIFLCFLQYILSGSQFTLCWLKFMHNMSRNYLQSCNINEYKTIV